MSSEGGVLAFLLYIMILWRGFANLAATKRLSRSAEDRRILAGALRASLVAFVFGSFFASEAYQFFPYFFVAYTTALYRISAREAIEKRGRDNAEANPRKRRRSRTNCRRSRQSGRELSIQNSRAVLAYHKSLGSKYCRALGLREAKSSNVRNRRHVTWEEGRRVTSPLIHRMCETIIHRGPDDEGIYIEGGVGLGMRRLSIIDVAGGHQPVHNEDKTVWIVFNGEIYNFPDLRKELESRGHRFYTNTDTEAIVHLYEEFGSECVQKLRGMFAFAIYDERRRSVLLARDRLGIKPLHLCMARTETCSLGRKSKQFLQRPQNLKKLTNQPCASFFILDTFRIQALRLRRFESYLPAI